MDFNVFCATEDYFRMTEALSIPDKYPCISYDVIKHGKTMSRIICVSASLL